MSLFSNPLAFIKSQLMPVGTIIEWSPVSGDGTDLSTAAKVAAYYGFGTWEAYGPGRMLLGADSSHAAGSTGGSEQVTLTEEQLPRINGSVFAAAGAEGETAGGYAAFRTASGKMSLSEPRQYGQPGDKESWAPNAPSYGVLTLDFGEGKSHTNMPPYLAVYCWKRTA